MSGLDTPPAMGGIIEVGTHLIGEFATDLMISRQRLRELHLRLGVSECGKTESPHCTGIYDVKGFGRDAVRG